MPKVALKPSRVVRKKNRNNIRTAVNITDGSGAVTAQLRTLNQKERNEVERATRDELQERLAGMVHLFRVVFC